MIGNPFNSQGLFWNVNDVEILDIRDPDSADDRDRKRTLEEDLLETPPEERFLDNQALKGWTGSADYYVYPQYENDQHNRINPLEGYWVKVTRSCEIIFKAPEPQ